MPLTLEQRTLIFRLDHVTANEFQVCEGSKPGNHRGTDGLEPVHSHQGLGRVGQADGIVVGIFADELDGVDADVFAAADVFIVKNQFYQMMI